MENVQREIKCIPKGQLCHAAINIEVKAGHSKCGRCNKNMIGVEGSCTVCGMCKRYKRIKNGIYVGCKSERQRNVILLGLYSQLPKIILS